MGRRKTGDDERELCRSLDYVIESAKALKDAVQMGRRLDGEGERKVDSKDLWCRELSCSRSPADASIAAEDVKAALRRMKEAKKTFAMLSTSLEDTIQEVSEATIKACQAAGFALLPDDVLIHVFEMYTDECIIPYYKTPTSLVSNSPQILSSVCRRFREVVLRRSNLWRQISLAFPKHVLLAHRQRCQNPILHIKPTISPFSTFEKMLDVVNPYHQWRELHLHVTNENHIRRYFEHLKPTIQEPFHALEFLSINIDHGVTPGEGNPVQPPSLYLDEKLSNFLSSWKMPQLTRLELRNILPSSPMQCENVTSLSLEFSRTDRKWRMKEFRKFLQSMPKIQSLSVYFKTDRLSFDEYPLNEDPPALPSLTSLELRVGGQIGDVTIIRFMALVNTQKLTRLSLSLPTEHTSDEFHFTECLFAIFAELHESHLPPKFELLEDFALDTGRYQGPTRFNKQICLSMPNVQRISLNIPHSSKIRILDDYVDKGALRRLRSLRVAIPQMPSYVLPYDDGGFDAVFDKRRCKDFEEMEIRIGPPHSEERGKARLQSLLGERLHWIESR